MTLPWQEALITALVTMMTGLYVLQAAEFFTFLITDLSEIVTSLSIVYRL